MDFGLKLFLAGVSGVLVGATTQWQPDDEGLLTVLGLYGLCGFFFAAGVLWPWLRSSTHRYLRTAALVVASAFSYWCAVKMTTDWYGFFGLGSDRDNYVAGSLLGAAVVLVAAWWLVPLRASLAFAVIGLMSGIVGGLLFDALDGLWYTSWAAWHAVIATALHITSPKTAIGARVSTLFARRTD